MNAMAPTRPTELYGCRVRLAARATAPAEARRQIRAAIRAWDVPVDPDVAALLTSELVTNAIRHEPSPTVTVSIACSGGELRVEVHDTSRRLPVLVNADADANAEAGRGLMLVATLAADWGVCRDPVGKAVYFTLVFLPGLPWAADAARGSSDVGTVIHSRPVHSPH